MLTGCKQFLRASVSLRVCVCVCTHVSLLQGFSVRSQSGFVWPWGGWGSGDFTAGRGGSVTAVSPLFWNNGWSSQLSLSRTALDSLGPLVHCVVRYVGVSLGMGGSNEGPAGYLEMIKASSYILHTIQKMKTMVLFLFIFSVFGVNYVRCCFVIAPAK